MSNPRIGENKEICRLGAAASKKVQQEKAEKRWRAADLRCLHCGTPIVRIPGLKVAIQMKRKYCDLSCYKKNYWEKVRRRVKVAGENEGYSISSEVELRSRKSVNRSAIAKFARAVYTKYFNRNSCEICGYDRIKTDVAHIKAVKDFFEDDILADINHIDNLIGLCKRCHWEFDNNIISEETLQSRIATRNVASNGDSFEG